MVETKRTTKFSQSKSKRIRRIAYFLLLRLVCAASILFCDAGCSRLPGSISKVGFTVISLFCTVLALNSGMKDDESRVGSTCDFESDSARKD